MSRNVTIAIVVVLLVIAGGWFLTRPKQVPQIQPVETPSSTQSVLPSPSASEAATVKEEKNLVKITADGFSPKSITIKSGERITWENTDSANHTVNSDQHPTHLLYPFLNLGRIPPGEKKSVTPGTGTFTYHDHLNPSLTGSITVQ